MEPLYVYETTVEMSTLIFQQAKALDDIEDFEGALYLYQNALTVQESTLGMYHEDTLKTYWSLGWSCYQLYTRNQKAYKEKLRKLKLSATNDDDTETYDMLRTRMNQKNSDAHQKQAVLSYFQRAWKISRHLYGDDHCTTRFVLDDVKDVLSSELGMSVSTINKYCQKMKKVFEMEEKGDKYYSFGDINRALDLYEKGLALVNLQILKCTLLVLKD